MHGDFGRVYDEEIANVYGFFAYRLPSVADAEDLTQGTFERALRAWARFDPRRAPARVWLLTIARNLLIDHLRANSPRRSGSIDEVPENELGTEAPAHDPGVEPELASALSELAPRECEVLALRFGADLTGSQIAEVTGLSLANVQQVLSRSLRRLRRRLEGSELDRASGNAKVRRAG
jgi:RNA polymerase sigma-70 factor (ECF subfamily)